MTVSGLLHKPYTVETGLYEKSLDFFGLRTDNISIGSSSSDPKNERREKSDPIPLQPSGLSDPSEPSGLT